MDRIVQLLIKGQDTFTGQLGTTQRSIVELTGHDSALQHTPRPSLVM